MDLIHCLPIFTVLLCRHQTNVGLHLQGEKSFFLQPGESLEEGIQDVYILSEEEGLVLRALQVLEEKDEVT